MNFSEIENQLQKRKRQKPFRAKRLMGLGNLARSQRISSVVLLKMMFYVTMIGSNSNQQSEIK